VIALGYFTGVAAYIRSDAVAYPTYGYVTASAGNATHSGYFEWYKGASPAALRIGYMGYDNTDLTLVLENSAKFSVTGGSLVIGTLAGVLKGTAGVISGSAVHADLGSIGANDHHNQSHVLDGADHTVSGLTTGHFLKATGAATFGFAAHGLTYSDVAAAPAAGNSSIVTVGTITSGHWHGDDIDLDHIDHTGSANYLLTIHGTGTTCEWKQLSTSNLSLSFGTGQIILGIGQPLGTDASPTFVALTAATINAGAAGSYSGVYKIKGSSAYWDAISVDSDHMTFNGGNWNYVVLNAAVGTEIVGSLIVGSPTGGHKGAGTINAAGDIYKNNTAYTNPDYVYDWYFGQKTFHAYDGLINLNDLETYLSANRHLPGISRETSGIFARADMILEKVEELSLYILQLHKRIAFLESKIQ
jgi:hypothetical protein